MTNSEKYENLFVTEAAPNDLDEAHAPRSRWNKTSRAVTGVAGGVALAAGLVAGASFGMVGAIEGAVQPGTNDPNLAYADEISPTASSTDVTGIAPLSLPGYQHLPSTQPLSPLPTVVDGTPVTNTSSDTKSSASSSQVDLPPLPAFDAGNTSSATPSAGGGTGTGGGGSYGDDHDGDNHHEDHEDNDD